MNAAYDLGDEALEAFHEEAAELLRNIDVGLNDLPNVDEPARHALGRDILRWLHTLKGAASVVGLDDVRRYVHELEEIMREIYDNIDSLDTTGLAEFAAGIEELHIAVQDVRPNAPLPPPPPAPAPRVAPTPGPVAALPPAVEPAKQVPPVGGAKQAPAAEDASSAGNKRANAELLRLRPEKIDSLHALVGELVVTRLQYDVIARRMVEIRDQTGDLASDFRSFTAYCAGLRTSMPSRVHHDLMARVARLGETITLAAKESSGVTRDMGLLEAQSSSVSASIEDGIRELRLVPLNAFFEEFARTVREAARETGKDARLVAEAGSAEIDRAVMMRLRDALGHLVRNAITHGIEPRDVRTAFGKNPVGLVKLEGDSARSRATIRVIDDGGGIDVDQVRRKAIRMGILSETEALTDDTLLDVLTKPGFSTRESADGLAGRGIGLDVVADAVRGLDGHIEVSTQRGTGTVFTIEVPITAATGIGLVVAVRDHSFGILLMHIERALRIDPKDIQSVFHRDAIMLDGNPISVVPLAQLIGLSGSQLPAERCPAVVLRMGKQRLIVTVDDVLGDQALVVKPLSRAFSGAQYLSGAAVQPDGSTLPVLHIPALFARAASSHHSTTTPAPKPRTPASAAPAPRHQQRSILVVDDSMTIRTLLRNILRTEDYEVTVAQDGKAGFDTLMNMARCDLVITDLEMPRMNGVELCRAVRSSNRAQMPVMVVTSVGDPIEQRRALEAGADAYIIKNEFEQARFLDVVARLSGRSDSAR